LCGVHDVFVVHFLLLVSYYTSSIASKGELVNQRLY
jgi:hypothetical protein